MTVTKSELGASGLEALGVVSIGGPCWNRTNDHLIKSLFIGR